MRRSLRGLLTLCWLAGFARGAAPQAERFPFVIGGDSETGSAADMSWLNARPAGADGFVTIRDGRFATSAGRLRIWGVNLCFNANFPERTDAEKVAARLAGLGINGVRMHHHDTAEAPRGIWAPGRGAPRALSAEMLDRQDYLLDQLHRRGIYANLNLHVGRALASRIGIDPAARTPAPTNEAPSGARLATPDGRVRWDAAAGERAHVVVNDRAVRAVWGLVGGRGFDLGGLHVDIGAAERDYAVLWLSSLDGKPVEESKRLLLVAAGSAGNAGMEWNETRTSVANRWGRGPAQANGIPAAFALRTPLRRVFALDSRGHRTAEVPVEVRDGRLRGAVGPECRTLWYEIAAP